ncbi:MAG TPA: arabinofuranosidase catalytic domain-containing protein [Actinospica sp.]|nr:arabinofuranosidase catalytic domain-containing protein [Actinospica sp.]
MRPITLLRRRTRQVAVFLFAAALAVSTLTLATATPAAAASSQPCDIYAAGGTPCQAAYSTTRAMFAGYGGPLYQIKRTSDGATLNIGLQSTGGLVNAAPQTSFCSGTSCTITELYDQTSNANNMPISQGTACSGCSHGNAGPGPNGADIGAPAGALPVTIGGQPAYGVLFDAFGTGYRINNAKNVPTGSQPEGIYMLTSSNVTSNQCCFDFGSAENNDSDDGNATMNAIYYGTDCWTQNCTGSGPWVGGDLENGMYFSNTGNNPANIPGEQGSFVSAWEKNNGTTNFTLKYGNGQSGGLTESYSGPLPSGGYDPMQVQPSIELGTGGDNTGLGDGEFFEGAVTSGFPTDATENAVQANVVAAGYANNTTDVKTTASMVSLKAHADGDYVDAANSSTSLTANATSTGTAETFDLLSNSDGTVSLRAHSDGDYVDAASSSTSLTANATSTGAAETFDLINNSDGSISLRAHADGDYVTAENAGAAPLIANRTAIGPWEEFDLVHDTVPVSLRAHADNDYVDAANSSTSLIANATSIGAAETFDLISNSDGSVSLRAHSDSDIVTAEAAGASPLIANRTAIGPWERFALIDNADGSISFRALVNGDFVTAENAGASSLIANRTAIGTWEEFSLIYD